jgi:hypothetical protein
VAGIRAGDYTLTVTRAGFATLAQPVRLRPRDVEVVALLLDLQGVAVTGSVRARGGAACGVTTLTAERIAALPPGQQFSLPDAIVTVAPGMIRGHDDFVHVRGHEIALNPVINGVSFWENPHALFSSGLSPAVIDSATVLTGAFPAEYGNRFGGVLDIVTPTGANRPVSGTVSASGGQAGRWSAAGDASGAAGRLAFYANASVFGSDRFLSPPDAQAINDTGRSAHVFGQVDANLQQAGMLRVLVMAGGTAFGIPVSPLDVELRPLARPEQRTRQQSTITSWSRTGSDRALEVSIYQRWSRAELLPATGPLTALAAYDRTTNTLGGKADLTRLTGRHAFKAGVDLVRLAPEETLAYDYAGYRTLAHHTEAPHLHFAGPIDINLSEAGGQMSAYAQDTVQLGTRVTANLGLRLDHYTLVTTATHASPRVNLAFRLAEGTTLHASYNRFFVPPPIEGVLVSSAGLTAGINEIGHALPALEPTVEDQLELGLAQTLGPATLAVTGYYRDTDDPMHTTVWPDARIYSYAAFDHETAYGLEISTDFSGLARLGLTGYVNYALARVDFSNPVVGGFTTEPDHLHDTSRFHAPMDQTHTLTAGLTWQHATSGAWAGVTTEYGSGTPMGHGAAAHDHGEAGGHDDGAEGGHGTSASRVPGHATANVSFGVDLRRRPGGARISLRLDVENVTDNVYLVAQESPFSPSQYATPRVASASLRVAF